MMTGSLLRSYKIWLFGCTLLLESEAGTIPGWPSFARLAHLPAVNHKLAAGEIYYMLGLCEVNGDYPSALVGKYNA